MPAPKNRILSRFPATIRRQLSDHLIRQDLEAGTVLHRAGNPVDAVYFPLDCVISVTSGLSTGESIQVGVIGNREIVGLDAFMGSHALNQTNYVVHVTGRAMLAPADLLLDEFDTNKKLRDVLLRYTQSYVAQLSQNVACTARHTVNQRLARWLLEVGSRINAEVIPLTHDNIALMLGVRRPGVSEGLASLQDGKLIRRDRKVITIVDFDGLKKASCECYETLQKEYKRLLGLRGAEFDGPYPSNQISNQVSNREIG